MMVLTTVISGSGAESILIDNLPPNCAVVLDSVLTAEIKSLMLFIILLVLLLSLSHILLYTYC